MHKPLTAVIGLEALKFLVVLILQLGIFYIILLLIYIQLIKRLIEQCILYFLKCS